MKRAFSLIIGTVTLLTVISQAAQAPLSPEELKKSATHIFVGTVKKVTSKVRRNANGFGNTDRVFQIQLRVEKVEKGKGDKTEKLVVLHAWKPERRLTPFPGPQGHSNIPKKDNKCRVYVQKIDGLYKVIHPNGFQPIKIGKTPAKS